MDGGSFGRQINGYEIHLRRLGFRRSAQDRDDLQMELATQSKRASDFIYNASVDLVG